MIAVVTQLSVKSASRYCLMVKTICISTIMKLISSLIVMQWRYFQSLCSWTVCKVRERLGHLDEWWKYWNCCFQMKRINFLEFYSHFLFFLFLKKFIYYFSLSFEKMFLEFSLRLHFFHLWSVSVSFCLAPRWRGNPQHLWDQSFF